MCDGNYRRLRLEVLEGAIILWTLECRLILACRELQNELKWHSTIGTLILEILTCERFVWMGNVSQCNKSQADLYCQYWLARMPQGFAALGSKDSC